PGVLHVHHDGVVADPSCTHRPRQITQIGLTGLLVGHQADLGRIDGYVRVEVRDPKLCHHLPQSLHSDRDNGGIAHVLAEEEQRRRDPVGAQRPRGLQRRRHVGPADEPGGEPGQPSSVLDAGGQPLAAGQPNHARLPQLHRVSIISRTASRNHVAPHPAFGRRRCRSTWSSAHVTLRFRSRRIAVVTTAPTRARLRPVDIGKPPMRGWLHAYAFFVAAVCGIVLCALATTRPGVAPLVSCAIYSVTVCDLFGTSVLYHRRVWTPRGFQVMRRLDHSMIFIFIAGTYTPFCTL